MPVRGNQSADPYSGRKHPGKKESFIVDVTCHIGLPAAYTRLPVCAKAGAEKNKGNRIL